MASGLQRVASRKAKHWLSAGGEDKTLPCGPYHGPDLRGLGPTPGIAGRSPSYIVRQLYDFKYGTRAGIGSALMKVSVESSPSKTCLRLLPTQLL